MPLFSPKTAISSLNHHDFFTQQRKITVSSDVHHDLPSGVDYIHWRSAGKALKTKLACNGNNPEQEEKLTQAERSNKN
jgi:hypothetical protein